MSHRRNAGVLFSACDCMAAGTRGAEGAAAPPAAGPGLRFSL